MSVITLPKYRPLGARDDETPEQAAERLHRRKNGPVAREQMDDLAFAPYQFAPFPCAMYREWDEDRREQEIYRLAGKYNFDLEKRRDRWAVESLVGEHETMLCGVTDFTEDSAGNREVVSALRERNEKQFADLLEQGWAASPGDVKAATMRFRQKKLAIPAAERNYEDRNLGEKAKAELDAIEDAASDHVLDVAETRRALEASGDLKKKGK